MVRTIFSPQCITIDLKGKKSIPAVFYEFEKIDKLCVPAKYHLQRSSHLFSVHFSKLSSLHCSHV